MKTIPGNSIRAWLVGALVTGVSFGAGQFDVKKFSPWAGYAIPNGIWLTGDFNGDGKTDILHAVQGRDYAHIWMSNGNGTFNVGTFRPWAGYGIPNGLWMTGDFNGDGKTDVLHAVQGTDYVNVWLSNGNGTFTVKSFSPWSGYGIPNGVWLTGDVNGDGKTDIVHAVAGTDYANVWLSNGNGTFTVSSFRPWAGYGIPNGIWLMGDFNGDGKADIVHAVQGTDYVNVWTSNGNATFTVKPFRPWAGYGIPNGLWMTGDFNGDGKTDIVHAVQGTDYVNVWTSNGNATFTVKPFRPWSGYGIPNGVWLAADFNGDGKTDIVHAVQGTDYANVWLSNGNATFSVRSFSPWAGYGIPNGLWLAGDITGDKKADIVHAVQGTDYVHPWISGLPKPGEFYLDSLEITQTVQSLNLEVPLVANKTTWLRAYLSINGPARTVKGTASGTATIASNNTAVVDPARNYDVQSKRDNLTLSLNFPVPAGVLGGTLLAFKLTGLADAGTGAALVCANCSYGGVAAALNNTPPLHVRVIGLRYTTGTPPVTYAPTALDYELTRSWLGRAYPVASVDWSQTAVAANATWPFGCGDANAQVAALRASDMSLTPHRDARTHYFGLVADGGGFMRGCAAGIPGSPDPATVASGPTGSGTWGWDTDGSYGDWYTGHELGHTFGRAHPGSGCGESADDPSFPYPSGQISGADRKFVGFESGYAARAIAPAALPGTAWHDVMTYCSTLWLSAYTYTAIRNRLVAENALPAGPMMTAAPAAHPTLAGAAPAGPELQVGRQAPPEVQAAYAAPPAVEFGHAAPPAIAAPALRLLAAGSEPRRVEEIPTVPVRIAAAQEFVPPLAAMSGPPPVEVGLAAAPGALQEAALAAAEAQAQPAAFEEATGDFLSVVARVNLTKGTGTLVHVNRVQRAMVPRAAGTARASLRWKDAAGKVLETYPEPVKVDTDLPPGQDLTGMVDAAVPVNQQAAALELLVGDKVVDTFKVSRRAPVIRGLKVPTAELRTLTSSGYEITWEAQHPDKAKITYNVMLSFDEGKTWETIAVNIPATKIAITPDQLQGHDTFQVKVVATDGFNTAEVKSDVVKLGQR
ncbi:MAG: VCBS repeat-containing protein [Acidobacteriia bacterium]|nr:VCBS repeat-containing protein [Terriglobia bacterium]